MKKYLLTSIFAAITAFSLNAQVSLSTKASADSVIAGENVQISVSVADKNDFPAEAYRVNLIVLSGGGTVSENTLNLSPGAAGRFILSTGEKPGKNEVKVYLPGVTPQVVTVEGRPSPPAELDLEIANKKISAGRSVAASATVRNTLGRAAADVEVVVRCTGGLSVSPSAGRTTSGGRFSFTVTAGNLPSPSEEIRVSAGRGPEKTEKVEVLSPRARSISLSANPPSIGAGTRSTLKAVVYDEFKRPMHGARVNFSILGGNGSLFPESGVTDRNGRVFSVIAGGSEGGEILLNCSAGNARSETVKVARVLAPPKPAGLKASAAHPFSPTEEATEIFAEVLDKDGLPVNGAPVFFSLKEGEGTFGSETAATKDGRAATAFTTGRKTGKNIILVKCGNLNPIEVILETVGNVRIQRTAGTLPARVELLSFPGALRLGGRAKLRALVTDENYNPVEGSAVNFEIVSGPGRLSRPRGTTDANGEYSSEVSCVMTGTVKARAICAGVPAPAEISLNAYFPRLYLIMPLVCVVLFFFILYLYRKKKIRLADLDNLNRMHSDLFLWAKLRSFIYNRKKFKALFFDLKNFGAFSVYFGGEKAETLLKITGGVIKNECSKNDIYGHLGGDDFLVITVRKDYRELAAAILNKVREAILTFYPEQELKRGAVCLTGESGSQEEFELAAPSVAIYNSERFKARSLNELLEIAGRLEKCAKHAPFPHAAEDTEQDCGSDKKRYRIGWFTTRAVFLCAVLCSLRAPAECGTVLSGWAEKQNPYAGERTVITAKLTDDKDRPVSNAYLVFSLSKGSGSLERGWAVTGDDGNASVGFTPGRGENVLRVFSGKATQGVIAFSARMERLIFVEYFCLSFLGFLAVLLGLKLLSGRLLLAGLDRLTLMRTRMNGEKRIRELLSVGGGLTAAFLEFRDFSAYNAAYGYARGEKAVKQFAGIIRAAVSGAGVAGDEAFYYGEDKFVIVSSGAAGEILKLVNSGMDAKSGVICEEACRYALEITAAVVDASVSKAADISTVMFEAGKLLDEAKRMGGSSYAVSGGPDGRVAGKAGQETLKLIETVRKETEEKEKAREEAEEQADFEAVLADRARQAAERLEKEVIIQTEKLASEQIADKGEEEKLKKQQAEAEKARREAEEARQAKEAAELQAKKAAAEAEKQIKEAETRLLEMEAGQRKKEEEKCLREEAERAAAEERRRAAEEERLMKELESLNPEEKQRRLAEERKKQEEEAEQAGLDREIERYESLLAADEGNAEYHEKLSELYAARGLNEKAADKHAFLGDAYYGGRYLKNALKHYSSAVELNPRLVELRVKISEIYLALGMDREAKLEYFNIADSYLNLGDLANAEGYARKAVAQKSIEARYILGAIYFRRKNYSEAANELELLVKIKPNHQKALQYLFSVYLSAGKYKDAFGALQKALKLDAAEGGASDEAVAHFCDAIDNVIAGGQYGEALTQVNELLKYIPDNPAITEKYAYLLEKSGSAKEAASAYVRVGDLFTSLKRIEDAKKYYEKASKIDSGNIRASAKAAPVPPPQAAAVPAPKDSDKNKKKPRISYL